MAIAAKTTELEETDPKPRPSFFRYLPGSLASMILHAAAIVILAFISLPPHETPLATILEGVVGEASDAELYQPTMYVSSELNSIDSVSPSIAAADLTSKSVNDAGQLAAGRQPGRRRHRYAGSGRSRRIVRWRRRQADGKWCRQRREAQRAQFFGVKASGRRFVFIVDSSNSMRGGKFDAAKEELMYAIRRLAKDQAFYVIFFDGNADGMLLPPDKEPPLLPVAATTVHINRAEQWMKTVENESRTLPYDAVKYAVEMVPDAIYLLTDGKFTDKGRTEQYLKLNNYVDDPVDGKKPKVVIHTICFWQNDGEDTLKAIAKDFGGTYRFVGRETKKDK